MEIKLSKTISTKYAEMDCNYGWTVGNQFDGVELPKKSKDGKTIHNGDYVRTDYVSGQVVFFQTSCEFRVKIKYCRYPKEAGSIMFYYPFPLGREDTTDWEIYSGSEPLEQWLKTFPARPGKRKTEDD